MIVFYETILQKRKDTQRMNERKPIKTDFVTYG